MKDLSAQLQKEAPNSEVFDKIQKYAQLAASTVLALQLSITLPESNKNKEAVEMKEPKVEGLEI